MPGEPWKPSGYDDMDVAAFKALAAGVANEGQQKRALDWIIRKAAHAYDLSYRPGPNGDRDTAFAEGARNVGLEIVKLINMPAKPPATEEPDARSTARTRRPGK